MLFHCLSMAIAMPRTPPTINTTSVKSGSRWALIGLPLEVG
jgi:hypothetical protein